MAEDTPVRRPLKGSCHCGNIQYIVFLTLPHQPKATSRADWKRGQALYRCNCSVCHKAGFLHVRVHSSPDDFMLLSPLDPLRDLGDYMSGDSLHFLFCKTCATRCFIFMGQGEVVDVDSAEAGLGGKTTKVWRPKKEGWIEGKTEHGCYLSVNGYTIEPGQEGFDLRDWTEGKKVTYIDYLQDEDGLRQPPRLDRPHAGGAY